MISCEGKKRVLIADGDGDSNYFLTSLFLDSGYDVASVHSEAHALRLLAKSRFDVLFVDPIMTGTKGMAIITRIRATGARLPIVVVSRYDGCLEAAKLEEFAASRVLKKPVGKEVALETVRQLTGEVPGRSTPLTTAVGRGVVVEKVSSSPAAARVSRTESEQSRSTVAVSGGRSIGRKRILVVDDEEPIRSVLRRKLQGDGYELDTARDGQEALEIFQECRPDVVITDLRMPRMDGVELARRLRKISSSTIVIVLTGHADHGSIVNLLSQGFDGYLQKPLPSLDVVSHAVGRCLGNQSLRGTVAACQRTIGARDALLAAACKGAASQLAKITAYLATTEKTGAMSDQVMVADPGKARFLVGQLHNAFLKVGKVVHPPANQDQKTADRPSAIR